MLRHAERIEEETIALERHVTGAETQLDGPLRLSSSDWFGTVMLSPVIAAFGKRHPKVTVELLTDARLYSLPRREATAIAAWSRSTSVRRRRAATRMSAIIGISDVWPACVRCLIS